MSQESLYQEIKSDFYHNQTLSKNPLRKWFHQKRYKIAASLVKSVYRKDSKIVDLGCGSCDWNDGTLKVFGVDYNKNLLHYGKERNRLYDYKIVSAGNTELPSNTFDIITAFEFLEHCSEFNQIIAEAKRLLKNEGYCIISVPFDVLLSLWRPLFFLQVIFQGYLLQNDYYKKRCGHVNHFSLKSIKDAFLKNGFDIELCFVMRKLTIFLVAKKKNVPQIPQDTYEDLTIILPTLNEEKNIINVLPSLINNYKDCRIIIADDGSQDKTKEVSMDMNYNNLLFLDRRTEPVHGLTASVLDAIDLVKTKYFVVIDADGQHPSKKIKEMLNILRLNNPLVIASRIEVEEQWSLLRRLISYTGTLLGKISLLLRGKHGYSFDILGGFFGCNTNFWKNCSSLEFKKQHFRLRGYKVLFDFLKYAPSHISIEEIYYKFETRKAEVSKISLKISFEFLKSCLLP